MNAGLRRAAQALARLYPMGFSLLWKAPLVLALVGIPEFIQHIVEIRLGMFDSPEAFRALAADPTRMAFGIAKIIGLIAAMLAAARYWATRESGRPWYGVADIAWRRFAIGFLLFMLLPAAPALLESRIGKSNAQAIGIAMSLILLPMLFLMLAGLFGDRKTTTRVMWRRSWPWAALMAALLVIAFVPAQWLHGMNHRWALGAEPALVWALMIFDSILVGLLAGLVGTALYLGYRSFADQPGKSESA
jgi:hypothetical protein